VGIEPQAANDRGMLAPCQTHQNSGGGRWPIEPAPILVATPLLNRARRMPINGAFMRPDGLFEEPCRKSRWWRRWPIEACANPGRCCLGEPSLGRADHRSRSVHTSRRTVEEPLPKDPRVVGDDGDQASQSCRCCLAEPSSARADPPEPERSHLRTDYSKSRCRMVRCGARNLENASSRQCCYPFVRADLIRKPSACSGTFEPCTGDPGHATSGWSPAAIR